MGRTHSYTPWGSRGGPGPRALRRSDTSGARSTGYRAVYETLKRHCRRTFTSSTRWKSKSYKSKHRYQQFVQNGLGPSGGTGSERNLQGLYDHVRTVPVLAPYSSPCLGTKSESATTDVPVTGGIDCLRTVVVGGATGPDTLLASPGPRRTRKRNE